MPPWMPSSFLNIPLKNDRSLSDEEIATIIAWAEQGAQLGDKESYLPPAATFAFAEVRADMTLQLDEPYVPDEDAQDDYRCFAFPLEIDSPTFVTAYEFIPEVAEMAHHGIVYLFDEALAPEIAARDYEDGRPGLVLFRQRRLVQRRRYYRDLDAGDVRHTLPRGHGIPGQTRRKHRRSDALQPLDDTRP